MTPPNCSNHTTPVHCHACVPHSNVNVGYGPLHSGWQQHNLLVGCVTLMQIFTGWVLTLLFACAISSLFVALGVNSPSRYSIDQIIDAQNVRLPLLCTNLPAGMLLLYSTSVNQSK